MVLNEITALLNSLYSYHVSRLARPQKENMLSFFALMFMNMLEGLKEEGVGDMRM